MPPSCLWLPSWCFFIPVRRKYALHFKAHLKYWRCWGIINPTAPVLTQEVYFSVDCFQRAELFCKGLLDLTLLWAHSKIQKESRNWRQKLSFIPIFPFFFVFLLIEPTQRSCPSFVKGPINSPLTCLLIALSLRLTKKEEKLSGAKSD